MFPQTEGIFKILQNRKDQERATVTPGPVEASVPSEHYVFDINERKRRAQIMRMLRESGMGELADMVRVKKEKI